MDHDDLIEVYKPFDAMEASIVKQRLESEGIACHIDGESVSGAVFPGNVGLSRLRLLVRDADADRARKIIEENDWPHLT